MYMCNSIASRAYGSYCVHNVRYMYKIYVWIPNYVHVHIYTYCTVHAHILHVHVRVDNGSDHVHQSETLIYS